MKLTFDVKLVQQLLDDSKNAKEWRLAYGEYSDKAEARPGLWIVGDQGVYLMSNSKDGVLKDGSTPENPSHLVAYAHQCDPTGDFDTWWENKRAAFGGDDGVEFLSAEFIEAALAQAKNGKMAMYVTPTKIKI